MNTFDINELLNIRLSPNKLVIRLTENHKKASAGLKINFLIDTQFSEEKHAPTTGYIVNQCDVLDTKLMEWDTEIETKVGDYVVITYTSALHSKDPFTGRYFLAKDGSEYMIIDYGDIITAKRGDEIIPVNGYILVKPVKEDPVSIFGIKGLESMKFGQVAHIGKPNKNYLAVGKVRTDVSDFTEPIEKGDIVVFSHFSDIPLEYDSHRSIDNSNKYFRMQRRDILCFIDKTKLTDVNLILD